MASQYIGFTKENPSVQNDLSFCFTMNKYVTPEPEMIDPLHLITNLRVHKS